jgi:hypothetical protein
VLASDAPLPASSVATLARILPDQASEFCQQLIFLSSLILIQAATLATEDVELAAAGLLWVMSTRRIAFLMTSALTSTVRVEVPGKSHNNCREDESDIF